MQGSIRMQDLANLSSLHGCPLHMEVSPLDDKGLHSLGTEAWGPELIDMDIPLVINSPLCPSQDPPGLCQHPCC